MPRAGLSALCALLLALLAQPAAAGEPAWDCVGPAPTPGDGSWEPAFATVPSSHPNPIEEARRLAERKLIERLCGTHADCATLRPAVTPGEVGRSADMVCAQVFIESSAYHKWLASRSMDEVRAKFRAAAEALLALADLGGKRPVFLVDKIEDAGAAGGTRVQAVLLPKIELALQDAGASMAGTDDRKLKRERWPRGVDILVRGQAIDTMEGRVHVVQVNWTALVRSRKGTITVVGEPVSIPASLVGPPPKEKFSALPASLDDLVVYIDARPGGSLCLGERTQLRLQSQRRLHVRVFDLYGSDGALLLFPNSERPDDLVLPGHSIELGGAGGFKALPVPGSEAERFLVLAAPEREMLGALADMQGYCRAPRDLAVQLHRGEGIPPGVTVTSDGFRIIGDAKLCGAPPPPEERAAMERALASLPECRLRPSATVQ